MTTATMAASHWDRMYETATRSAWTQNADVERAVYLRMTDEPGFWLSWVFEKKLPKIRRLLSIGCGDGAHELGMARNGYVRHIEAFDASPVAIAQASAMAKAENLQIEFSVRTFEDFASTPSQGGAFDAVLFAGSLHHVTDIEGMLSAVRHVLKPGGYVILNEYVGPCYQLYPNTQVDLVNRVHQMTPPEFRHSREARLDLPTIDMIMDGDPTEGVRSALIPLLVPMYFRAEYVRWMGGALLHPLFGCLNAAKVNDGSPESRTYVAMLIAMEDELTRGGVLGHDFMFGVFRRD